MRDDPPPSWPFGDSGIARLMREQDWSSTPLGPPESWPGELRCVVDLMLASRLVATVAVGPERVLLYNDAAAALYGDRHPRALGRPLGETWPEAWAEVGHLYERVFRGEAVHVPAQPLDVAGPGAGQVFDAYLVPVRDAGGAVIAAQMTGFEVGARLRAEAALRASEERQAFLLRLSDALRPLADPTAIQAAAARVLGEHLGVDRAYYVALDETRQVAIVQGEYRRGDVPSLVGMHAFAGYGATLDLMRAGKPVVFADVETEPAVDPRDLPAHRALGLRAFLNTPLVKEGRLVCAMCVISAAPRRWTAADVDTVEEVAERTWAAVERAQAEAAFRDSDERLRAALAAGRMGHWTWDVGTGRLTSSDTMDDLFGLHPGERWPEGRRGFALLHPDDRERHVALVERHRLAGEGWQSEFRIIRPRDGKTVWLAERAEPSRDPVTGTPRITGLVWDITALKQAAERQQILSSELQHRVRNILSVTRSIVSRSDDGERSTEEYVQHLQGRIGALARTQVVLTRSAGAGVDLEMMIRDELLAQTASEDQFTLAGPDVSLSPKAAEVLTLALHELATNATKYGAFSRARGRVEVRWGTERRDGEAWLRLQWAERGVPIVDVAPRREGFGSELLQRRIPYELKGRGSFELRPGGLHSVIEFPLLAGVSILQTDGGAHDGT